MKTFRHVAMAMLAGIGIGGVAVQALHAQAKTPVYYVAEVEVTDQAGYQKNFVPQSGASVDANSGGQFLARGGKVTTLDGEAPYARVVIQRWDSMEQFRARWDSPEQKKLHDEQRKYAKVRAYVVEGVPAK